MTPQRHAGATAMPLHATYRRPVSETMEPRILHSADLSPLLAGDTATGLVVQQQLQGSADDMVARSNEIVFVDLALPDAATLLDDLHAQQLSGRPIEIVTITPDSDGLTLITDTLAGRSDITAVHVLAHGSDGSLQLGQSRLDAQTLLARADQVAAWSRALSGDADLLLYGCDFAQTGVGQQLVRDLALLSGADVAASTDLTGAAALAGNWTLEYGTGPVEAGGAVSLAGQTEWRATMALLASDAFTSNGTLNGKGGGTGWSGNWSGSTSPQVTGSGLLDPAGVMPVAGGSVQLQASGLTPSVAVSRNMAASLGATGTTTWISFLLQPNGSGALHYSGIEFGSGLGTTGFAGYVGGNFEVGVAGTGANARVNGISATANQTALLVLKIDHAAGDDLVTLYVNPTPGAASPGATFSASTNLDLGNFNRIAVVAGQLFGSTNSLLDEIRVGQTYAEVAPSRAPAITSNGGGDTASISVFENVTAVTTVTSTDLDGPAPVYSISGGADASKFSIGAATGVLTFKLAPDFEAPTDVGLNNVYDVIVRAFDGTFADTQAIAVTVLDVSGSLTVTTSADDYDGDVSSVEALLVNMGGGTISLREALTAANNTAGTDTIILPAGNYNLTRHGSSEDLNVRGDLDVRGDVTITGAGADTTTISAGGQSGVFHVVSNSLTMSGVTVRDGAASSGAGIIVNGSASLNLSQSVVRNNTASNGGGGVYASTTGAVVTLNQVDILNNVAQYGGGAYAFQGQLIATDTRFDGNTVAKWGAGVYVERGSGTLTRITASNNSSSDQGGGIYLEGNAGTLALVNSTVSGNSATNTGGGIYVFSGALTVTSSTIAGNTAPTGGGVYLSNSGTATLRSTIVAGNTGANSNKALTSLGNNIDSGATLGLNQSGDLGNTDPMLAALASNGGFTQTRALLTGSPAINAGHTASAPSTDQRGVGRVGAADIGAYEFNDLLATPIQTTGETRVNTNATGIQETSAEDRGSHRAVAMAGNGDYVVVWSSKSQDNGSSWGVYGQRFDASGAKLGVEFRVNQTTSNDQRWATVAMDASGRFVVTWTSTNQGETGLGVYARTYAANGSASSSEFRVNSTNSGNQSNGSIAMDADGNFIVVWKGNGVGDSDGIFGRRFTAAGNAIDTNEFRVNADLARAQYDPAVSMNASGAFVVTWDNNQGVQVQRYASTGTALGGAINVNGDVTSGNGSIALADDGSFVVVWRQTVVATDVFMRRYDSAGVAQGPATQVNAATTASEQTSPSITMDSDRNFIVAWEGNGAGDNTGVWGQKFNASGTRVGGEFLINTTTNNTQEMVSLAMADMDNFVAVWSGNGPGDSSGVFARQYGTATAAPTISAPGSLGVVEDMASSLSGIVFADADAGALPHTATFTVPALSGSLTAVNGSGVTVTGSGSASVTLTGLLADLNGFIAADLLTYTTAANATASVALGVAINDGTNNASTNVTLTVSAVNDPPMGAGKTVTILEDAPYTFTLADFPLSDPLDSPANTLLQVRITTLPSSGTLRLQGTGVTAGADITATDIGLGRLVFTPLANANGAQQSSFTFQVRDNGGTGNGGVNLDPTPRSMAFTITAVNDAPVGANKTVTVLEDASTAFLLADFGFSDPNDALANQFANVKITSLPAAGSLKLSGVPVALNQFIPAASVGAGALTFTPAADASGAAYASFGFRVQDDGGTANGGVDLDTSARTMTVNVTAINDAPSGANKTVAAREDVPFVFAIADFGFTDTSDSPANALAGVTITVLPAAGSLKLDGTPVLVNATVPALSISTGKLTFESAPDMFASNYASFQFRVQDDGGTSNGGIDLDPTARTMRIDVTSVNDAPMGADNTLTLAEDGSHIFVLADFGFSDPNDSPPNSLSHVRLVTLPGAGTLTLSGGGVIATQEISLASINAGNFRYTPAPNASGLNYASFDFKLRDNGGTANGGVDLETSVHTLQLDVTPVNDAPINQLPPAQNMASNDTLVFSVANGNALTLTDVDAGAGLVHVTLSASIGTLSLAPAGGPFPGLTPDGGTTGIDDTSMGFTGTLADINTALDGLAYKPGVFAGSATLTIVTNDLGNTGGAARSDTDNLVVNVSFVNVAPVLNGALNLADTFEDAAADAGTAVSALILGQITDDNNPGALAGIAVIGADNTNGVWQFSLNGGQDWTSFGSPAFDNARLLADDGPNRVRFFAAPNWNGTVINGLTFRAWDQTSGVSGGSADTSTNGNTSAFSTAAQSSNVTVTAVNDAPAGSNQAVTLLEDTSRVFAIGDFGFTDPTDSPAHSFAGAWITRLPLAGSLVLNGMPAVAGDFATRAAILGNQLVFTPAAHANGTAYASFDFRLQDDGGTANGGVDLALQPYSMTINVTAVNDAPQGSDKTIAVSEDQAYKFELTDFGFSDPFDTPANGLLAVRITTLPAAGNLTLNGAAIAANALVPATDISAQRLVFTPAAEATGTPYTSFTFQVQDNGGVLGGGVDQDLTPRTLTLDVTATNDAPTGADTSINLLEDASHVFDTSDFGFSDPLDTPANLLLNVRFDTVPAAIGSLKLGALTVVAGQFVSAADIAASQLVFVPTANTHGSGSFTFRVQDDGGVANNGVDLDATARTVDITIDPVNDAPLASGVAVLAGVAEDTLAPSGATVSALYAGNFDDSADAGSPAMNQFAGVAVVGEIVNAAQGRWQYSIDSGANWSDFALVSDTDALVLGRDDHLRFLPVPGYNGAVNALTVRLLDNSAPPVIQGGVRDVSTNGATSAVSAATVDTTTIVLAVNDAPVGEDRTVSMLEDTPYTFVLADFAFSDPGDSPADALAGIDITALPLSGTLGLSGTALAVNDTVAIARIIAGDLLYTPANNTNGIGQASFTFRVRDDGGTANGGLDRDSTDRTMRLDVVAVNDAPSGANFSVTMLQGGVHVFDLSQFVLSDTSDSPANQLLQISVTSVPGAGVLALDGVAVYASQRIAAADIGAGKLRFTPAANSSGAAYASFSFLVQDDGGTANGGDDLDQTIRTATIDVTPVNQAPTVNAPASMGIDEDVPTALTGISFSDPNPGGANVTVTLEVDLGSLAAASEGTVVVALSATTNSATLSGPIADINSFIATGKLVFTPAVDSTTAVVLGSRISQTGPGALSSSATTTITVNPVNDAPTITAPQVFEVEVNVASALTAIVFADVDARDSTVLARFSVASGELATLGDGSALGVAVAGSGTALTLSGSITNINSFVRGGLLVYTSGVDQTGDVRFDIVIDDAGNTGSGGPRTAATIGTVRVNEASQPPTVTAPAILDGIEDEPLTLSGIVFTGAKPGQATSVVTVNLGIGQGSLAATSDATVTVSGTPKDRILTGTVAAINGFIAAGRLVFTPVADAAGNVVLTSRITDAGTGATGAQSASTTSTIVVAAVNDAPTISAPTAFNVPVNVFSALGGIVFADVDAGESTVLARFSVASGTLGTTGASSALAVVVGGSGKTLSLSGTIANINSFIRDGHLGYTITTNDGGGIRLDIGIDDGGHSGAGGARTASASATITALASDQQPGVSAPATISLFEDTPTALSGIGFSQAVNNGATVTVRLLVDSGMLSTAADDALVVTQSDGATQLRGTLDAINRYMATGGVVFTPAADSTSSVSLISNITEGVAGQAGALSASATTSLTIIAVNDAPTVTGATTFTVTEDEQGALRGILFADVDAEAGAVTATLRVGAGTLLADSTPGVSVTGNGHSVTLQGHLSDINAYIGAGHLSFRTDPDATDDVRLDIAIDDNANSGSGGALSAQRLGTIGVIPVNDAPRLVSAAANRLVTSSDPMLFQLPAAGFFDPDVGDVLHYSATLANGSALPPWLHFDASTRTFSGTPPVDSVGVHHLRVVATDLAGASAQALFSVTVTTAPDPFETGSETPRPSPEKPVEAKAQDESATEPGPTAIDTPEPQSLSALAVDPLVTDVQAPTSGSNLVFDVEVARAGLVQRAFQFADVVTTPVAPNAPLLAAALLTQLSEITLSGSTQTFLQDDDMLRKLEEMKRQMALQGDSQQFETISAIALSSGISIGYVIWLVRGGILVGSMLSALPAWQMLDPLPVVASQGRARSRPVGADNDDPEVEQLFDEHGKVKPAQAAPTTAADVKASAAGENASMQENTAP